MWALFFQIDQGKTASAARNSTNSAPQSYAITFALTSNSILNSICKAKQLYLGVGGKNIKIHWLSALVLKGQSQEILEVCPSNFNGKSTEIGNSLLLYPSKSFESLENLEISLQRFKDKMNIHLTVGKHVYCIIYWSVALCGIADNCCLLLHSMHVILPEIQGQIARYW